MRELYVFIAIKGDLYSVVITENDTVLTHKTQYKKSKDKNISIRAMKSALSSLGRYVNNDDCLVNFVMPNSYIEKWIKDGYSKADVKDEFEEMLDIFNALPIQYRFLDNINNKATQYLKTECVVKVVLDTADNLLAEFEDN